MSLITDSPDQQEPPRRRFPLMLAVMVAVLAVAASLGYWMFRPSAPVEQPAAPAAAPAPAPEPKPAEPPPPTVTEPAPAPSPTPRRARKPEPPPPPPEPAAPTMGELHIEADVPGAMAFLDREYLGTLPVTAKDIKPGTHQLNVSAEGHDGIVQTIEVEPGRRDITVRFKEVRLDARIDVVHKHGIGSCDGALVADINGLRYLTSNKSDAFAIGFDKLEAFEVDYLKKNLRVKIRGGKTFNFTDKQDNADRLFVFHRDVQKALDKMKQQ